MDGICARAELATLADARTPSLPKAPTVGHDGKHLVYSGIPEEHCDALLSWAKAIRNTPVLDEAHRLGITLTTEVT